MGKKYLYTEHLSHSMSFLKQFTFPTNHEPEKKSFEWIISEDKVLLADEIDKLRATCRNLKTTGFQTRKFHLVRSWFVVELGLFTGLRVEEMVELKIEDILINEGHGSVIVRHGKGNKKRTVWINSEFRKTCKKYLRLRQMFGLINEEENFLLTSQNNRQLTKRALQKQFKFCIKKANLPEHYSIHCLRHTYGTFLLKASGNIKLVKEQLGHSSIQTTEVYVSLLHEDTRKALEELYQ